VQTDTNRLVGCHATQDSADDQLAAVRIAEADDKAQGDAPNYRPVPAGAEQKCSNCRFNTREMFCELFDFVFEPDHVCDAWEDRAAEVAGKVSKMTREYKSFPALSVKIVDEDQGIVEHIITVFGILDLGNDVSHPGSFTKTLAERGHKSLVLDMHNTSSVMDVLGKPLSIMEVPRNQLPAEILREFPEATGGVKAITQFFLDTPEGKGAFIRLKRDGLREWSYGYDTLDSDFSVVQDKDGNDVNARNLRTIKLYEYGPVLWGMNQATATLSAKNKPRDEEAQEADGEIEQKDASDAAGLGDDGIVSPQEKLDEPAEEAKDEPAPDEEKIGRSISARNGDRIVNAIVALASVLEGAGFDIPGFGVPAEEAAAHEDEEEPKSDTTANEITATVPDEDTVNTAPVPDEQAAQDQPKAEKEAGPDDGPPTSEGDELAIDFDLEQEELSLLTLGG
jgi:hypothetical protein